VSRRFVENPAFAGQTPRPLTASCHDRSPFVTIRCTCGADMHLHETQLAPVPTSTAIGVRCQSCREPMVFEPGELEGAFARMRADGWIE
jgi:hypothetical protein